MVFSYDRPPSGETVFDFFSNGQYRREIWRCRLCGHFVNHLDVDLNSLYEKEYVDATYGKVLLSTYQKVMALPPDKSDNYHRVKRINGYLAPILESTGIFERRKPTVLDVGSGLCVFLARMKKYGWECTALDPDSRSVEHARNHVSIPAICGDFMKFQGMNRYDLITFNKVLEHVPDPVEILKNCHLHLGAGGYVYVEVPDGEMAVRHGKEREEFFIEHFWAFSMASLNFMSIQAGFDVKFIERIQEPSTKFTLRAFLKLQGA